MSFPQLDEDPIINLSASGPYLRHVGTSGRATLAFQRLDVVSAGGGVKLHDDVDFTFDFDHDTPDQYRLDVDQPFEPDGPSRRPPSAGGYRLTLPFWMLEPLLSVPARGSIQIEFSKTSASIYASPPADQD